MLRLGAFLLAVWLVLYAILGLWAHDVTRNVVYAGALVVGAVLVLEALGLLRE